MESIVFKYLGSNINRENNRMVEMKTCLTVSNRSYYGLMKHLNSKILPRNMKMTILQTLIRPILEYGAEAWVLTKQDEMQLGWSKRKILVTFMDPYILKESGEEEPILNFISYIIVKFVKLCRLRRAGHVMQISENDPAKKVLMLEPGGRRPRGRPKLKWQEQIEEGTARVGCRGWKVIAVRRDE
jgi:hypothetical protein